MRVRDWQDILEDVVESDADPSGWRAVGGDRAGGIGEDLYFGHPSVGVYQVKTYARNPFRVEGVGAEVARRIDDELDPLFPEHREAGMFGVRCPDEDGADPDEKMKRLEAVVRTHADAPTTPDAFFEDIMDTLESPAYGPMEFEQNDRPDRLDSLASTFDGAEQLLDAELDDLIDGTVDRGFQ